MSQKHESIVHHHPLVDMESVSSANPLEQWFSKWAESPFWGDFEGQQGEQNKSGDKGLKQRKGAENAQTLPPIDHWVTFGCDLNALKQKKPLVDS